MNNIIIVDFDETLALFDGDTSAKNIPYARPNTKLINALNALYDGGYEIHIYTARGHFSANSREEAQHKYSTVITQWLTKNGVKFNILSFNKPLGVYYIDDKAIRPDEIDILEKLSKG
jgi:histidinol phosphatase-like enzyme